ncbi:MAG TPA: ribonuclease HII [Bacilli bacterium]|jgi:ribonuclease HII|nr:ribonuclease HII [Bacilli bacterium]HNZ74070.1 ribonuclease HII [Bacilli bacterium]HPA98945.1 ribonuclease HII [Bacilli bacterium]HPX83373.1 ribonuclease HII [Bacilli bacterium]HQB80025.1 ribonuclease HII [Bacilli bacterium]
MTNKYDEKLHKEGYKVIVGLDEAGRGPMAGPLVVAGVALPEGIVIEGLDDSKKLSAKKREVLSKEIKEKALAYKIIFISEKEVDKINVLEASKKGMIEVLETINIAYDLSLSDAIKLPFENNIALIKGDQISYNIAAASILAKVARDEYMIELDKKYPEYNFKKHKGYVTKEHLELLNKYGPSKVHRKSFKPVTQAKKVAN